MEEWVRWAIGIMVPAVLAHGTWITVHILRITAHVFGARGDNGLMGDVRSLKTWREDFRAELPKLFTASRHEIINRLQGQMMDLERRVRDLERRP